MAIQSNLSPEEAAALFRGAGEAGATFLSLDSKDLGRVADALTPKVP